MQKHVISFDNERYKRITSDFSACVVGAKKEEEKWSEINANQLNITWIKYRNRFALS